MVAIHPLVAEVFADLVDTLEAADDEPLEIELVGDAQVKGLIEGVVVGNEGPGRGAAVERLQHRGFDLQEAEIVQEMADCRDHPGSLLEGPPHLGVRDEIGIALAVADLDVLQALPLLRWGVERLGEWRKAGHPQGYLAGTGAKQTAGGLNEVTEIDEPVELLEGLRADVIDAEIELKLAVAVADVGEHRLAHVAPAGDPAGDGDLGVVFRAGTHVCFELIEVRDRIERGVGA